MGILHELYERKLVYIETTDSIESTLALDRFRLACDTGRSSVLQCVVRGKVAEGTDFDKHYGRAVIFVVVPYQDIALRARPEFMRVKLGMTEN